MMATSSALRQLSAAGVVKNTYPHKKWQSCIPPSAGMCFASCFLAGKWEIPALRPSHPHVCRKRAFRQGQALRSRFAGDGEEASDGGPVKGSSQRRDTRATIQKQVPHISRFSPIPARCGHDTCKLATAYASQSLPMRTSLPPARRSTVRSVMYIMPPLLKAGYRLSGFP